MAKVYIVQENPKRNVLAAAKFGDLEVLLPPREQIVFSSAPTIRLMRKKLEIIAMTISCLLWAIR